MKRKVVRAVLFLAPLLLWIVLVLLFATNLGGYMTTWKLTLRALNFSTPEFAPVSPDNRTIIVSMYQLNQSFRRVAHVLTYATMALLVVRSLQWGRPRLRPVTVLVMVAFSALITGAESIVRLKLGTERHVRLEQLYLNLFGTGIALLLTLLFFGVKALERRTEEPSPTE